MQEGEIIDSTVTAEDELKKIEENPPKNSFTDLLPADNEPLEPQEENQEDA